ncbi:MAG TPA: DUF5676 family membrane protein [Candidatus Babeliales bacterium]|nr:DUF5676 family membrane protein [Candidatus Babeliales bacterium]
MKINARDFGIAGAITVCIIYISLALALKFWPSQLLNSVGTMHMMPKLSLIKSFIKVTPHAIVLGCITHTIMAFLILWFTAKIYNFLQK